MTEFNPSPGDRIQHTMSRAVYFYMGIVPKKGLAVIVNESTGNSYTIEERDLQMYYKNASSPDEFRVGKSYRNKMTGSVFHVEKVATHPDTGTIAFGFVQRISGRTYPHHYPEHGAFDSFEIVDSEEL